MAQSYVRLSSQISQKVAEKLEKLLEVIPPLPNQQKTTKTQVIEQAINELYERNSGGK
jgi:hypothetical protein